MERYHPPVPKERSCDGKRRYNTRSEAKRIAKRTTRQFKLDAYHCQFCDYFHVGRPLGFRTSKRGRKFIDANTVLDLPESESQPELQEV